MPSLAQSAKAEAKHEWHIRRRTEKAMLEM